MGKYFEVLIMAPDMRFIIYLHVLLISSHPAYEIIPILSNSHSEVSLSKNTDICK